MHTYKLISGYMSIVIWYADINTYPPLSCYLIYTTLVASTGCHLGIMNRAQMKGNNFKNADKFNELFYKSIPQDAKEDIIAELEQIQCND